MSGHVVFGTGQVGSHLVAQLVDGGREVTAVSRSGRRQFTGATNVAGDATDPTFTKAVSAGADVVYFCLDAPDYHRWPEQFPPLQHGVLTAAQAAGARLVVLENLYGYGPVDDRELDESLPLAVTSAKGRTRVAMTRSSSIPSSRDRRGRHRSGVGLLRPRGHPQRARRTRLRRALAGKSAQIMGDPDRPHTYSYTPDVAAGLIVLGAEARAGGEVWHLPVAETWTTRHVIEHVYGLAGSKPKLFAVGRTSLRLYGLIKPEMREYLHTLYQFTEDWTVSDARFRATFGDLSTPLPDALATTVDWYAAAEAA